MDGINEHNSTPVLSPGQFFGKILHLDRLGGFQLSDAVYECGRKLPKHSHELAFFCLLLDGAYTEHYAHGDFSYNPYTTVFHPPDSMHQSEMAEMAEMSRRGCHFFNIEIPNVWLDRLREYAALPETTPDLHGGEMTWLAMRLYREYREFDACSPLAIEGLALEMLASVARKRGAEEKRAPVWLARAIELLRSEFHRNLTVNEVAAEVGVHPLHLSRVFRQFHHQSIGEYTHRLRIQFACQRLSDAEVQLADLAAASGFADQSHFTRVFKQITGLTPGAFQKMAACGSTPNRPTAESFPQPKSPRLCGSSEP
ncbi:MAG: helix-turn-helix domain-containing protein [Blastocatellales bacterium]